MTRLGMLVDLSRCIGCDACTIACKQENATPKGVLFARVLEKELPKRANNKKVFIPILCNHCEDPPCLKSCPTRALYKREDGTVLVNADKCAGEGTCVGACPYGAMFLPDDQSGYAGDELTPFENLTSNLRPNRTAMKCTFCYHRVNMGLEPACVITCPVQCRIFGDLDDPKSKPSLYIGKKGQTPLPLIPQAGTKPNVLYFSQ
ncbi:MAG: 4Fe-4S dicluster domain-containing protein [Thaumarchaeota archaeon]|nr:4Fe-4S dicluster domain-containing protein [Nitrososphaerota archaeon]